jgi:hypothetical protein
MDGSFYLPDPTIHTYPGLFPEVYISGHYTTPRTFLLSNPRCRDYLASTCLLAKSKESLPTPPLTKNRHEQPWQRTCFAPSSRESVIGNSSYHAAIGIKKRKMKKNHYLVMTLLESQHPTAVQYNPEPATCQVSTQERTREEDIVQTQH